jgi:hypothetical protein
MRDLVERLWREAQPDPDAIARYLRGRGLSGAPIPPSLRFHPALRYVDEDGQHQGEFPGLVARVESVTGEFVGLHRTFLDPEGTRKADVPAAKKLLAVRDGATRGAAIRLAEAGEVLALAEGIETALAVMEATGTPAWATISAGGMELVEIPPTVRRLELWADCDANGRGQRAAEIRAALAHSEGVAVFVLWPPEAGQDWRDVLEAEGVAALCMGRAAAPPWGPPRSTSVTGAPDRPSIDAGDKDLERVTAAAWAAFLQANSPAAFFRHGDWPVRIEHDDHGAPVIRPLTPVRLRHHLARLAFWYRRTREGRRPAEPPESVVLDMLARPDLPLPILERVVEAPVFAADGTLQTRPGYHPAARTYYEPAPRFTVPRIPDAPTAGDVTQARAWLLEELLGDFPFIGDAERAHAVALLLLPFVRALIDGPTPFHLVEKPAPGTGASLLVTSLLYPALGRPVPALTEGRDEDEWRKRLSAMLRGGREVVLIDNLRRRLESAALAAAITTPVWEDRVLGASEMGRWPVTCAWVGTGNNPALSDELTRRTVRIRLDARAEQPWLRTGFRHPDLRSWLADHRGELVRAALVFIRAWLLAGRPEGDKTIGMFETWSRVMGGILTVVNIPGFLGNLQEFYDASDTEVAQLRAFLDTWWERHHAAPVTVSELYSLATSAEAAGLDLDAKSDQGRKVKLGQRLSQLRDRRYRLADGTVVVVTQRKEKVRRAALWQLEACESVSLSESFLLPLAREVSLMSLRKGVGDGAKDSRDSQDSHSEACDCRECIPEAAP